MTRTEAIEHWKNVALAVLMVDGELIEQWKERIMEAAHKRPGEMERVCDEYLTAVATEIVNRMSDEEQEVL